MEKIYRFTLIFLLVVLFLANLVYFVYNGRLLSYFETSDGLESAESVLGKVDLSSSSEFFDLEILENERYQSLKDFEFKLPSSDIDKGDVEINDEETVLETSFDLGNPNPFKVSF
ncbi:MAG: hypothetical protein ACOXZ1_01915 [Patescibacteria group bacterium]|jgi:hypothetical protein